MSPASDAAPAPLSVGVDALNILHDRRGIGRYVRALIRRWTHSDADRIRLTLLVPHPLPALIAGRFAHALGLAHVQVERRARSASLGLDLVWHPWNGIFFDTGTFDVATIHDVWPFVDAPADEPRLTESRQRPFLSAAKADRIVTDSAFSKSEIVRHLAVDAGRIEVVPLGVDRSGFGADPRPTKVEGADRYVLFVGETEGRKDLSTLLSAFVRLPDELRRSTALVVAGRLASSASIPDGVRVDFTGEVGDAELASLYAGAAAFAFPSVYEGFGLPVLEAMAFGAPVIASDAASIPEAGGDAASYYKAGDAAACAQLLERVLTDEPFAAGLRERGLKRAALMTWDRCAEATLVVFEDVAGRSPA